MKKFLLTVVATLLAFVPGVYAEENTASAQNAPTQAAPESKSIVSKKGKKKHHKKGHAHKGKKHHGKKKKGGHRRKHAAIESSPATPVEAPAPPTAGQ